MPLALSAFILRTIIGSYFVLDDFPNLFLIVDDHPLAYLLTPYMGHVQLARNAIFYLMFQLFATDAAAYFWSALLTHLINVALAFLVVRELTGNPLLAAFGAGLWGTSPLNVGTLSWYSAYGHAAVATALLIILLQWARAAARQQRVTRAQVVLWYALALFAATSFASGVAIAIALPFALPCFLPPNVRPTGVRFPLWSLLVVVPVLYVGLTQLYVRGLGRTPFWATTDVYFLLSAWRTMPILAARLVSLGVTRLVCGWYFPGWMRPGVWYLVTAFVVAGCGLAMRNAPEIRRPMAGCALLLLACYGSIAVGRAAVFATLPLDVFLSLSRYHYVGQLLIALAICLAVAPAVAAIGAGAQAALLGMWCAATLAVYACCSTDIDHHDAARSEVERELTAIRAAIVAQPPGGVVRIDSAGSTLYPFWNAFPGRAALFVIFFPDNTVDGRHVYFVEPNRMRLRQVPHGRRTATLFLPD